MNTKSTQFVVGDTVQLTRAIGKYPAGTTGTVVRVDDDGLIWIKAMVDNGRDEKYILAVGESLEKIEINVVKGTWVWNTYTGRYHCSRCGGLAPILWDGEEYPAYCPNCGADMREEIKNG